MRTLVTILVTAVVLFPLTALATIINIPGDYPTIQEGIDHGAYGDTVLVQPDTYFENVDFAGHSIVLASNFLFTEDPQDIENTIIDGGGTYTTVSIQSGEDSSTRLVGFSITNGLGTGNWPDVRGGGIHISSGAQPTIEHCYIHDNLTQGDSNRGAGIYANSAYCRVENCRIYRNESGVSAGIAIGNGATGVVVEGCELLENTSLSTIGVNYSSDVTISRTLIHDNIGMGIRNWGSSGTSVVHCTISNNTDWGIYNTYYSADVTARNSILTFNGSGNVENYTRQGQYDCWVLCEYSDVLGGTGQEWFGVGCIDADPVFVGLYNDDFSLRWGSPCIDSGDPNSPLDPDGTRCDMGAFYFNQDVDGIVELYPDDSLIVIPPEGGEITYDGWVFNFFGSPLVVDIWSYAYVPEIGQYGPLDRYDNVSIPSSDSVGKNNIRKRVPGAAPAGEYSFAAYIGDYPSTIIDSSCFYFTKTGSVAGGIADWQSLKGWFDGDFPSTQSGLPTHYALSQNYPNPFNARTSISYQLPADGYVTLEVYNSVGQRVVSLVNSKQQPGYRSVTWDASNVSSGVYFYKLTAGDYTETKRMMLVK
ncbi:MAG: right-handed parallel beta-helix repeat-containing protein [Candidatus Zixiibacteriota bacterium]